MAHTSTNHPRRYIRDLITQKTTHLIADKAGGDKYNQAKRCHHLEIVTPDWLEECHKQQMRLPTHDFLLGTDRIKHNGGKRAETSDNEAVSAFYEETNNGRIRSHPGWDANGIMNTFSSVKVDSRKTKAAAGNGFQKVSYLEMATKSLLEGNGSIPPNPLFSGCCFFLVGFPTSRLDNHNDKIMKGVDLNSNTNTSANALKLKQDFSRLIRRGMGTIFWEINKDITHVIVNEDCDLKIRTDVTNFCNYHPNSPLIIAPEWVIACLQNRRLIDEKEYPPNKRVNTLRVKKKSSKGLSKKNSKMQLFSGLFFHILSPTNVDTKLPSPCPSAVSFKPKLFEKMIASNGGQLLSRDGICLLQNQPSRESDEHLIPTCYVVHLSGAFHLEKIIQNNALLSHISQHKLCIIKPVNPIWLQTCERTNSIVDPLDYDSEIFQPQTLPMQLVSTQKINGKRLKVAVTGFVGAERIGLRNMLNSIGAMYTDDMGSTNTHLICKTGAVRLGPKYLKAVEWKLNVVTVAWLYRIAYHGYEFGCEDAYSLLELPKEETQNEDEDEDRDDGEHSQGTTILCSQDF